MEEQNKQSAAKEKMRLFWKIQKECWRRMVTPFVMYLFMSILLLASQTLISEKLEWLRITLGIVCILGGAFFNGHLCYHFGKMHYDAYLTGCIHRNNAVFGIQSGNDHHVECEYRVWKGFYIGFLIGVPVIILGAIAGSTNAMAGNWGAALLIMLAGWAIVPLSWLGVTGPRFAFSILFIILPVLVSGVFYILGAMKEKKIKEREAERSERVKKAGEDARKEHERREQTEEQRRKTLQSKKKKR